MLSRRAFLKLAGAAAAAGIIVPAFIMPRDPYVKVGDAPDYIGPHPTDVLMGTLVTSVREWDGVGYPVGLSGYGYPALRDAVFTYDFNLCILRNEVPADFWRHESNWKKYNNVHTYMREKRFGETVAEAVKALNFASSRTTV